MKLFSLAVVALALATVPALVIGQDTAKPADPTELKDLTAKASYAIGLSLGKNLKQSSVDAKLDLLSRGLQDGYSGAKPLLTDEQIREVMQEFGQLVRSKQAETAKGQMVAKKAQGEKNLAEGMAFLAKNKKEAGVITTPSGLQYKVIREGTGKIPGPTDKVLVHYSGKLLNGQEFDSSYKRGEPLPLDVNGVIAGWTEALQKMKTGSKWQLFIPANLAYREEGTPDGDIPPNSTLIFDIELLKIQ